MGKRKWNIENVTKFVLENSDCNLESNYYNSTKDLLDFICDCGEPFSTTFETFKDRGKRQCNKCGRKNRIKSQTHDYEYIKKFVENFEYKLMSKEYLNNRKSLILKDKDGYYYEIRFDNLKSGQNPAFVHKSNKFSIYNIRRWLGLNDKPFTLLENKYKNNTTDMKFYCKKCKNPFYISWAMILRGEDCNLCSNRLSTEYKNLYTENPDLCKDWNYDKNTTNPINYTISSNKLVWWKCSELTCGHEWIASINNRSKKNGTGCPQCFGFKGEIKIEKFLSENKIDFISQYSFKDCRHKRELRFDFAVFDKNNSLVLLIEYQGEQHYRPVNFGGMSDKLADINFQEQIRRDNIKYEYCLKRNLNLLTIPYWNFNNINQTLNNELN